MWRGARGALARLVPHRAAYVVAWSGVAARWKGYEVRRDVPYVRAGGWEGRLDLYLPREAKRPVPVLLYLHGGGWMDGSKELASLEALRYADMGFAVANVAYRLTRQAGAPAAVEDVLCALRWVGDHAAALRLDTSRIVLAGTSAGGHLALLAAMAPAGAFQGPCGPAALPRVRAVVNWYGPADLTDLVMYPPASGFTRSWLGAAADSVAAVRRLSPIAHVERGGPAVLTVHGSADSLVPARESVALHRALDRAGIPNRLLLLPGAGHGYPAASMRGARAVVRAQLAAWGVLPTRR